jgi:hypothetical protein
MISLAGATAFFTPDDAIQLLKVLWYNPEESYKDKALIRRCMGLASMVSSSPISPELMRTAPKVRDLTSQTQAFNQEINRQVSKTNDGMKVGSEERRKHGLRRRPRPDAGLGSRWGNDRSYGLTGTQSGSPVPSPKAPIFIDLYSSGSYWLQNLLVRKRA